MSALFVVAWIWCLAGWIIFAVRAHKEEAKLRAERNELRNDICGHRRCIKDLSALLDQASDCLAKNLNVPESKAVIEAWKKLKGEM